MLLITENIKKYGKYENSLGGQGFVPPGRRKKNVIFFTGTGGRCCTVGPHRRTRTLAGTHPSAQPFGTAPVGPHRWTAPSDTNPCGNAPFGTALRRSPISHPSSSWHQSYPYIHIHIHQPYIYIYLSWVIVGLAGECVKVALRVL